jgi:hypothetical protein
MERDASVILNAADLFARRQREVEANNRIMALPEEIRWVGRHIADQPAEFFGYLTSCSQRVAAELQTDFGSAMQAALILENGTEESSPSGVYYRENYHAEEEPWLMITSKDVKDMAELIEPLLVSGADTSDKEKSIEIATAATCWMYLGAWAFTRLDPRRRGEIDESPESYAFWAELVDLDDTDMHSRDTIQHIKQQAEVIKWRIAGRSAYEGILHTGMVTETEVKAFQRMYFTPWFTEQVEANPNSITPERYALANPFERESIMMLFSRLGLVQ